MLHLLVPGSPKGGGRPQQTLAHATTILNFEPVKWELQVRWPPNSQAVRMLSFLCAAGPCVISLLQQRKLSWCYPIRDAAVEKAVWLTVATQRSGQGELFKDESVCRLAALCQDWSQH